MRNVIVIIACLFWSLGYSFAGVQDSIGVEKKDGKRYVLHRIEAKETLYALSKKYGTSVEDIKKANTDVDINDIKIGQVIRVPRELKTVTPKANTTSKSATHIVIAGETLYSISRKYNVSVDELKKANPGLDVTNISIGDEVKIPGVATVENQSTTASNTTNPTTHKVVAGETLYSISKKYNLSVEDVKKMNPDVAANGLKIGQTLTLSGAAKTDEIITAETKIKDVTTTKTEVTTKQETPVSDTILTSEQEMEKKYLDSMSNIKIVPNGEFKKVTETGFAEVIEGGDTDKYLALHKTAPVGTIIQVINEANSQRIFIRVIGKLPANGLNDKVVLKISKKAFSRLAGVDKKIPVTLSYIM